MPEEPSTSGAGCGVAVVVGRTAGRMVGRAEARFGFPSHHRAGQPLAVQGDPASPANQHAATSLPGRDAGRNVLGRERIGVAGVVLLDRAEHCAESGSRRQFLGIEFAVAIGVISAHGLLGNGRRIQGRHLRRWRTIGTSRAQNQCPEECAQCAALSVVLAECGVVSRGIVAATQARVDGQVD